MEQAKLFALWSPAFSPVLVYIIFLNLEFKMLYLALLISIYYFIKTNNTDKIVTLFIDPISY